MKTVLYINNEYCLEIDELKEYFSSMSDKGSQLRKDLISAYKDGILKDWLSESDSDKEKLILQKLEDHLPDDDEDKLWDALKDIFKKENDKNASSKQESQEKSASQEQQKQQEKQKPRKSIESPKDVKVVFAGGQDKSETQEFEVYNEVNKSIVTFKMVHVDGGTFMMGATGEQVVEAQDDEKPVKKMTLSGYWIGETQVTQALWEAVMGDNPSVFYGETDLPVESISWYDCERFINKLNEITGKTFRLPTEAEWEFAARGGKYSKGFKYAGSNEVAYVAWYRGNADGRTHRVASGTPNELGLYDMSGNVWEWCEDKYDSEGYVDVDTGHSNKRASRGGSWGSRDSSCRVSRRYGWNPSDTGGHLGLRLALTPDL